LDEIYELLRTAGARKSSPLRLCMKDTLGYSVLHLLGGVNRADGTHSVIKLEEQVTAD